MQNFINKTINGGLNWGYQLPDTHNIPIQKYYFINFYNDKIGWAYSNNGIGIHTTTGGDSIIYVGINQDNEILPNDYRYKLLKKIPSFYVYNRSIIEGYSYIGYVGKASFPFSLTRRTFVLASGFLKASMTYCRYTCGLSCLRKLPTLMPTLQLWQ